MHQHALAHFQKKGKIMKYFLFLSVELVDQTQGHLVGHYYYHYYYYYYCFMIIIIVENNSFFK